MQAAAWEGVADLWQAPILPVVDFDDDKVVGITDLAMMIDNWGTDANFMTSVRCLGETVSSMSRT